MGQLIPIALMLVSSGVSAYASYDSAKQQQAMANYSAAQQDRAADLQLRSGLAAAALQRKQAEASAAMAAAEAGQRFQNAKVMEADALTKDRVERANQRTRRAEMQAAAETQRAQIAARGVLATSGTPLDLIAETAGAIERDQADMVYAGEAERRSLLNSAATERWGGKMMLAGAMQQKGIDVATARLRGATAYSDALNLRRGASLRRMEGAAAKRAGTLTAASTLLSGASSAAGSYYK